MDEVVKINTEIIPQQKVNEIVKIIPKGNLPMQESNERMVDAFLAQHDVRPISKVKYKNALIHFFSWVQKNNIDLRTATKNEALAYKENLIQEKLKTATIGGYIISCRVFYDWLESAHRIPNIFKGVKNKGGVDEIVKKPLTEDESLKLLDYFKNKSFRDYVIVNLLLRTGIRTAELTRTRICDIQQFKDRWRLMILGKGRIDRAEFVWLEDKSRLPILEYLETRKDEKLLESPIFANESYNCKASDGLTTVTISTMIREGLNAIGLRGDEWTAHSLRTTFACILIKRGARLEDVQRALRHKDIATTQRYLRAIQLDEAYERRVEALLNEAF